MRYTFDTSRVYFTANDLASELSKGDGTATFRTLRDALSWEAVCTYLPHGHELDLARREWLRAYEALTEALLDARVASTRTALTALRDEGDALAATALARLDEDAATARARTRLALASVGPSPGKLDFWLRSRLRTVRSQMADLHTEDAVALSAVFAAAHASAQAERAQTPVLTFLRTTLAPHPSEALQRALEALADLPELLPRSTRRDPAVYKSYMRDYMRAYRAKKKTAPATLPDPAS